MSKKISAIRLAQAPFISIISIFCMGFVHAGCPGNLGELSLTSSCTDLSTGNGLNTPLTINSGVTVSSTASGILGAINMNGGQTTTNYGLVTSSLFDAIYVQQATGNITNYGYIANSGSGTNFAMNVQSNITGTLTNASGGYITSTGTVINNVATINALVNSGNITSSAYKGIYNTGTITTLTNTSSGVISATTYGIHNSGTISSLTNSGTITSSGQSAIYLDNGSIGTFTNNSTGTFSNNYSSTIQLGGTSTITQFDNSGTIGSVNDAVLIRNNSKITTFNNNGDISGTTGVSLGTSGSGTPTITTLNNKGSISGTYTGVDLGNASVSASISQLNNSGSISGGISGGIRLNGGANAVNITSLYNTGTITSTSGNGISLSALSTITTLQNDGTISGATYGINNAGTISTLNNKKMIAGSTAAINNTGTITQFTNYQSELTYQGAVPVTYSPGFSGIGNYGTLIGAGTGFTGTGAISVNPGFWANNASSRYLRLASGVGLSASTFTYAQSGQSYTYNGTTYLMKGEINPRDNSYYVYATPTSSNAPVVTLPGLGSKPAPGGPDGVGSYATAQETSLALQQTRTAIQDVAALQTQSMISGFSYDCQVFDANNICVSAGGRYTNISPDSVNNSSIILVGAYKVDDHTRVGVSIDQNLSASNANGIVNQNNKLPMFGAFAVWNQNPSLVGWGARANIGYGQKGMDVTRPVITAVQANDIDGTASEQGQGSTKVSTFGAQAVGRYGFDIATDTVISPYLGLRYMKSSIDGFSEAASSIVALPLTYSAFGSNATTAVLGGQLDYRTGPWSAWLNLGMEYDMNYSNDYINVTGFGNVSGGGYYNPSIVRSRFVSGAYGAYDIAKNQRVSLGANFRQTEFSGVNSASIMAFYSMGF
jgi:hypothetical protein